MATLSEYFDSQARHVLARLERGLQQTPLPDAAELHRAARELRGTAQMAREERVYRAVSAFEDVARALAANALSWSEEMAGQARETMADLRVLVDRDGNDDELDARADAAVSRWGDAVVKRRPEGGATATDADGSEFRQFAAREITGISEALDTGVEQMAESPMDREPLRMILRRQRALLGSARLDEIPVIAEILRAIEDLTRVIAKLDVGVKQEWLDIYRVAREGLRGTIEPLQRNEDPEPSHALSRLRHMREELLERYGVGEAVSAAHESEGLVQAQPVVEPPAPQQFEPVAPPEEILLLDEPIHDESGTDTPITDEALSGEAASGEAARDETVDDAAERASPDEADVVPIEALCYSGDSALARALELRAVIDRMVAHDPTARDAADELFDLIRIARD